MSLIDEQLLREQETRRIRPPRILYATDLTHPCPQQIHHKVTEDRPFELETLRIFQAGNLLEDYWINILAKRKDIAILSTQVPAYQSITVNGETWEIHGRIDILTQHDNGWLVAHEVKTTKSTYYIKKEGQPKEDHVAQLQFYLNALAIDHGQVDYLDKTALLEGRGPIDLSFPIARSKKAMKDILSLAEQIVRALQSGELPPTNPDAWNRKVCDYCSYRDLCVKEAP